MFNADKQVQVKDVKVVSGALFVRLKGIKQDPRMQRPEAAGNEDWIVMGDVPGSDFSIMFWVQLLFGFHQGSRDQDTPFFVKEFVQRAEQGWYATLVAKVIDLRA